MSGVPTRSDFSPQKGTCQYLCSGLPLGDSDHVAPFAGIKEKQQAENEMNKNKQLQQDRAPVHAVFFTATELRHQYMRKAISLHPKVDVLRTYCEHKEEKVRAAIEQHTEGAALQERHLQGRRRSEEDFFAPFVTLAPDYSHPVELAYGAINTPECLEAIVSLQPDVLAAYGCSLVKEPLLEAFAGRFLNVHLGLSPYYRGTGTNFWPLVNGEPEYVGATFMHIDAGVDTGEIIHQIRARIYPGDTPHQIGNRLIADIAMVYGELIARFNELEHMPQPSFAGEARGGRYYMRKDFSPQSVEQLYANFTGGMIQKYLDAQQERDAAAPLVVNPCLAQSMQQD